MNNPMPRINNLKVSDIMAHKVVTVRPTDRMSEVASVFVSHAISSAPVVNQDGVCTAVISAFDFLKRDLPRTDETAANRPSSDSGGVDTIESLMSSKVKSIRPDASLLQVASAMCSQHVHRLPVIDRDGKPIGIVSTMDVVAALLNAIDEAQNLVDEQGYK